MTDRSAPVAARGKQAAISSDANLHVEVTGSTKKFHLWQQLPNHPKFAGQCKADRRPVRL